MNVKLDGKWLAAGSVGVVLLLAIAIAAWQIRGIDIPLLSEGHSAAQDRNQSESSVAEPDPGLKRCANLWNSPSTNAGPRSSLAALEASYVSITVSALYPDKCLITAANPELNLSAQFLEGDSGSPYSYDQIASGEASTLPASVTNWNASTDSVGNVALHALRGVRD